MYWVLMALQKYEHAHPGYKTKLVIESNGHGRAVASRSHFEDVLLMQWAEWEDAEKQAQELLTETGPHTFTAYYQQSRRVADPYSIQLDLLTLSPIVSISASNVYQAKETIIEELSKNPGRLPYLARWQANGCIVRLKEDSVVKTR